MAFAETMEPLFHALGILAFNDQEAALFFQNYAAKYGCESGAKRIAIQQRESAAYALSWLRVLTLTNFRGIKGII